MIINKNSNKDTKNPPYHQIKDIGEALTQRSYMVWERQSV